MTALNLKADTRAEFPSGYLGGKGQDGVFQTIINEIPPCEDYWELFAGNASIYRRLTNKPQRSFLIEMDTEQAKILADSLNTKPVPFDFLLMNLVNKSFEKEGTFVVWASAFQVLELLRMCDLDKATSYFFVDPPYLLETRTSSLRYNDELTPEKHTKLLNHLLNFKNANIGICTYPNSTYKSMLQQWRLKQYKAVTRGGTVRIEQLWMNYKEPNQLQDVTYHGGNYREREKNRKQQKNWLKNFKAMHPHQQQAVLKKLIESYQP